MIKNINLKIKIINFRMKKIMKKKFKRFNKKVNRIINANKNNSKYSETEKIALIKSDLDAFYSSKDIDKVKDCTLIKRKKRLIFFNSVLYRMFESLFTGIIASIFIIICDLKTDKFLLQLLISVAIILLTLFFIRFGYRSYSSMNGHVNTEIAKYELKLIKKELKKREANHKKVHQKEYGRVKVTVKRIK